MLIGCYFGWRNIFYSTLCARCFNVKPFLQVVWHAASDLCSVQLGCLNEGDLPWSNFDVFSSCLLTVFSSQKSAILMSSAAKRITVWITWLDNCDQEFFRLVRTNWYVLWNEVIIGGQTDSPETGSHLSLNAVTFVFRLWSRKINQNNRISFVFSNFVTLIGT